MATKTLADTTLKICCTCRADKPLAEFGRSRNRPDGLYPQCKPCRSVTRSIEYRNNRERERARSAEYHRRNRDDRLAAMRTYYRLNHRDPHQAQHHHLLRKYGLSGEEYDAISAAQGHRCAICREHETDADPQSGKIRRLAVDHDHDTGVVRGLLCRACNVGLGLAGDSASRLLRMAEYLLDAERSE